MDSDSVVHSPSGLPIGPAVDVTPATRPPRTPLIGRHVSVVPFEIAAHGEALFVATHGPEREALWLYLGDGPFADRASFDTYLARWLNRDDPVLYAIVDHASGHAVGHAAYMRIEPGHKVIEVGNVLFAPTLARTAAATEAMVLMARHVFEDLGYRRYEWKCNALNAPSRRAALRLGFTFEGVFRRHMIQKGRSRDTAWFAMLAEEWPARRAAYAAWLSPENFDAAGRQRRDLGHFIAPPTSS